MLLPNPETAGAVINPVAAKTDTPICGLNRTLNALRAELKQEVGGVRSHDFWAAGDLAFTCALTGDDQGALDALQRFESCSPLPPTSAYSAYIDWIGAVAQLDAPRKEALNRVKVLFENRMKSASGNVLA
jgi:hypothetical protein